MPATVKVLAPAKLNLALAVGAPDATGMHPIASWMVTVDLFDELHLTRLEPGRLSRYAIMWHADAKRRSDINWSLTKDLAVRAHLAIEQHTGRDLPVQLKLEKRIPVGGGLGGGSSNAAAMLRGINELFDLRLSTDELTAIASSLGSDVPFLVKGGSALVEGVGDRLMHHDPPALHAVIAFPEASCPTAQVYRAFDEISAASQSDIALQRDTVMRLIADANTHLPHSQKFFNDLAAAAIRSAPQLKDNLQSLAALAERDAHVSGSGSSLFVVCDHEAHSAALASAVERELNLPAVAVQTTGVQTHASR